MCESSITKDCSNRRAVKYIYVYIKMYIHTCVYLKEKQYYATTLPHFVGLAHTARQPFHEML